MNSTTKKIIHKPRVNYFNKQATFRNENGWYCKKGDYSYTDWRVKINYPEIKYDL